MICGILYPEPSPTGLCARRYVELLQDEFDIDIICLSSNGREECVKLENGMSVHTVIGKRAALEYKSSAFVKRIIHLIGSVQIKTLLLGNLKWFSSLAQKKLEEINKEKKIDAVFSVCSPVSAHVAASNFKNKHPEVKWCAYTVDPYSTANRIRPIFRSFSYLVDFEQSLLSGADSLLLSEEVYDNRKELYDGHKSCEPLPDLLPDFDMQTGGSNRFDCGDINCVYAGRLYPELRAPDKMLSVFSKLGADNIKLHLFTCGCDDTVAGYVKNNPNILLHKQVGQNEIKDVYREADVLVNIGNNTKEFFPSKTFEYVSARKPIIHFFGCGEPDKLFESYPLALQIDNNTDECDIDKLREFIEKNSKQTVAPEEIEIAFRKHTKVSIGDILKRALTF